MNHCPDCNDTGLYLDHVRSIGAYTANCALCGWKGAPIDEDLIIRLSIDRLPKFCACGHLDTKHTIAWVCRECDGSHCVFPAYKRKS